MEKVKIPFLIILSLMLSAVSMALIAYQNFSNQEMAHGIIFTVLSITLISFVISSIVRNRLIEKHTA